VHTLHVPDDPYPIHIDATLVYPDAFNGV